MALAEMIAHKVARDSCGAGASEDIRLEDLGTEPCSAVHLTSTEAQSEVRGRSKKQIN